VSKHFIAIAFGIGVAALLWVGQGFVGSSWLALTMTAVIGGFYLLGAFELRQYRVATAALEAALQDLSQAPPTLDAWLDKLPPSLRNAVRLRIDGERVGLPGPALTPYLVGLLVMLGMLGTFLGMVVTFKGAVFALEASTDLQAIRSALAQPIKGLGLAFGTSVAGVAGSAMLGLMLAISRRERQGVAPQLDRRIATVLQPFSLAHQRQETFRALQAQARTMPEVVGTLQAVMERMERRSQELDQQLLDRQAQFQREVTSAYTGLAQTVGTALKESLADGAKAAGESIRPVVETAMTQIVQESQRTLEGLAHAANAQAASFTQTFEQRSSALLADIKDNLARTQSDQSRAEQQRLQAWTQALQSTTEELQGTWRRVGDEASAQQQAVSRALEQAAKDITERAAEQAVRTLQDVARLLDQSQEMVRARAESESRWLGQHGERMDQLAGLWRSELSALRREESERGEAAATRLGELQAAVAQHLATLGAALEAPITRLLHTASEVPQAAAGVIAQLRQEMGKVAERDNIALQERTVLLQQLATLLQAIGQASSEQRAAMEKANGQFAEALDAQAGKAADVAAHITASALELSSLAEAFGHSVQLFQASSENVTERLQRLEASLERSTTRSDEQLAYYLAQAREIIDLSIASQQGLVEHLRQLPGRQGKNVALGNGGDE
jgi:hypothetical protein